MKPGYFTTEFWLTGLTAVAGLASTVVPLVPPPWGPIIAAAVTVAYSISRGIAKAGAPGPAGPG